MKLPVRLSLLARVLCLIVVALMGSGIFPRSEAWGQSEEEGLTLKHQEQVLKSAESRGGNLKAKQQRELAVPEDHRNGYVESPNRKVRIPKLPPVEGFQQLAGSAVMKTMFKNMITEPVPVMFQTMMMVENGAATGFIGSMNSVSNLFANQMQASDLQLQFMGAAVSNNEHKVAYVESVFKSMKDQNQNVWPAALSFATGDKPDEVPTPYESFEPNDNPSGSSVVDIAEAVTGNSSTDGEYYLANFLFTATEGESNTELLTEFRDDLTKWVGDYHIEQEGEDRIAQEVRLEFIRPTERRNGPYRNNAYITGYEYKVFKETESAWQAMNRVMRQYCEFKVQNRNQSRAIFEKERPSMAITDIQDWGKTQSIDIGLSVNFIDQFFKLMLSRKTLQDLNCDLFQENNMPDEEEMQTESSTNFDTCDSSADSPCLARLILFNVAKFIGKHNAEWFYRDLSALSLKRSLRSGINHLDKDIFAQQTAQLFCQSLNLPQPCNPVATFDERMRQNKLAFQEFGDKFAKFAQGQGGASVFKPVVGNQANFDAGQGG